MWLLIINTRVQIPQVLNKPIISILICIDLTKWRVLAINLQVRVLSRYVEKIGIHDITNGSFYDTCNLFNNIRQDKFIKDNIKDISVKGSISKKEKRNHIMIPVSALNLYAIVFILKTICLSIHM